MVDRVIATEAAAALIADLRQRHGTLMFYLSHGCCDGSTPMCFLPGDMALTASDVQLGEVAGVPFHTGRPQLEYLQGTQLILDVVPGSLGTFSLEDADGHHFVTRSWLWNDEESAWLAAHPLA
jgi:uncharacterized protein